MFYDEYVALCGKRKISPSAAAEAMGFQRSVVTRWSKGVVPRRATLERIAQYFHVPVSTLSDGEGVFAQKESPTLMSEVGTYWAERLSELTASDQALLGAVADRLEESPEATRAGIGLLLAAVQSAPRVP